MKEQEYIPVGTNTNFKKPIVQTESSKIQEDNRKEANELLSQYSEYILKRYQKAKNIEQAKKTLKTYKARINTDPQYVIDNLRSHSQFQKYLVQKDNYVAPIKSTNLNKQPVNSLQIGNTDYNSIYNALDNKGKAKYKSDTQNIKQFLQNNLDDVKKTLWIENFGWFPRISWDKEGQLRFFHEKLATDANGVFFDYLKAKYGLDKDTWHGSNISFEEKIKALNSGIGTSAREKLFNADTKKTETDIDKYYTQNTYGVGLTQNDAQKLGAINDKISKGIALSTDEMNDAEKLLGLRKYIRNMNKARKDQWFDTRGELFETLRWAEGLFNSLTVVVERLDTLLDKGLYKNPETFLQNLWNYSGIALKYTVMIIICAVQPILSAPILLFYLKKPINKILNYFGIDLEAKLAVHNYNTYSHGAFLADHNNGNVNWYSNYLLKDANDVFKRDIEDPEQRKKIQNEVLLELYRFAKDNPDIQKSVKNILNTLVDNSIDANVKTINESTLDQKIKNLLNMLVVLNTKENSVAVGNATQKSETVDIKKIETIVNELTKKSVTKDDLKKLDN